MHQITQRLNHQQPIDQSTRSYPYMRVRDTREVQKRPQRAKRNVDRDECARACGAREVQKVA
jgi:hypothetical protein